MATYTIEQLYYDDNYNIMGAASNEIHLIGTDNRDLQTAVELQIVKHTLLAMIKLKKMAIALQILYLSCNRPFLIEGNNMKTLDRLYNQFYSPT